VHPRSDQTLKKLRVESNSRLSLRDLCLFDRAAEMVCKIVQAPLSGVSGESGVLLLPFPLTLGQSGALSL
jgi:hypothetical protein